MRDLLCARYDLGAFRQLAPEFSAVDPELRGRARGENLSLVEAGNSTVLPGIVRGRFTLLGCLTNSVLANRP